MKDRNRKTPPARPLYHLHPLFGLHRVERPKSQPSPLPDRPTPTGGPTMNGPTLTTNDATCSACGAPLPARPCGCHAPAPAANWYGAQGGAGSACGGDGTPAPLPVANWSAMFAADAAARQVVVNRLRGRVEPPAPEPEPAKHPDSEGTEPPLRTVTAASYRYAPR